MLNYGSIRLSTVGDEQTYLFTYVDRPKEQFRVINHVVQQVDEGAPTKYHKRPRIQKAALLYEGRNCYAEITNGQSA